MYTIYTLQTKALIRIQLTLRMRSFWLVPFPVERHLNITVYNWCCLFKMNKCRRTCYPCKLTHLLLGSVVCLADVTECIFSGLVWTQSIRHRFTSDVCMQFFIWFSLDLPTTLSEGGRRGRKKEPLCSQQQDQHLGERLSSRCCPSPLQSCSYTCTKLV